MLLSELNVGEKGIIVKVRGQHSFRKRISEMGFVRGQKVQVVKEAPLKDPVEYCIMGYMVTLRRSEASLIEMISEEDYHSDNSTYYGTSLTTVENKITKTGNIINVAMVGNPNSGKTSIFNYASRSWEKVGNYSGVTVAIKLARVEYEGYIFNFYDLPGTYSLTTYSPEELYVRNFLFEYQPDIIINVIDSTNIERNLHLTTQLIDMNLKVVIALNMSDELKKRGDKLDYITFGQMIGIPMIPTVGSKGKGLASLFQAVINKYKEPESLQRKININYGRDVESAISIIEKEIINSGSSELTDRFNSRFLAIKLIENDDDIISRFRSLPGNENVLNIVDKEIKKLKTNTGLDTETIITDAKYGFIEGALKEVFVRSDQQLHEKSQKADFLLTHKKFGIPIFLILLWLIFSATFILGKYPTDLIEFGFEWLSEMSTKHLPPGPLTELLRDGIFSGVGGVMVFLPNILLLFFFISLMEDTGYMARAAFIMDEVMHKIGLHGKSFIPLIMGFGCNVPAIMATRIIESRNNRLITMLILPFMSCSARLPVYILIISAFFPSYQGTILFFIYLTGILIATISAIVFKKLIFKGEDAPFVMELPPYRVPSLRNTIRHMWNQSWEYLKRIAGVILLASVIVWGLNYYPVEGNKYHSKTENIATEQYSSPMVEQPHTDSYLERFGKAIEPIMRPLGFDWKMSVSLLAGITGKEIVVSTLGVLYSSGNDHFIPLGEKLKAETYQSGPNKGNPVFTPVVALTFLLFILIYFPCIAVVTIVASESGSFKWSAFLMIYTTALAYLLSFIFSKFANYIYY